MTATHPNWQAERGVVGELFRRLAEFPELRVGGWHSLRLQRQRSRKRHHLRLAQQRRTRPRLARLASP